jgi:hypothetical protein
LLESAYDCVDRIVVNAYYPLGQRAGGFRTWWRQLTGSDETLDRAHLERMAGRFKRRLQAYAVYSGQVVQLFRSMLSTCSGDVVHPIGAKRRWLLK